MELEDLKIYSPLASGGIIHIKDLKNYDWARIEISALTNIKRYGGHFENAISVGYHTLLVAYVTSKMTVRKDLVYSALHHEIEEAYGVSDISSGVKKFILQDKTKLEEYKFHLHNVAQAYYVKHRTVKDADDIVGAMEAMALGVNLDYYNESFDPYQKKRIINEAKKYKLTDVLRDYSNKDAIIRVFMDWHERYRRN